MIGVSSGRRTVKSSPGTNRATVLYTTYTDMVRAAGGTPIVLTPGSPAEADEVVGRIDGLLLSGGGDVDPDRYGGEMLEAVYAVDPERDAYETALVLEAAERRLPTLLICRGMQVANVAFGGTLYEDVGTQVSDSIGHRRTGDAATTPQHTVALEPGSTTATALGKDTVEVNTIHHQALRDVADAFRVTGRAPDGIVEAVEPADPTWPMWAVQWHPEYMGTDDEPSIALFRGFIEAASR